MITLLVLLVLAIAVVLGVPAIRKKVVTRPVFGIFKKILPPLSATEREAMEAGSVWWDGELFRGNPDWKKLHGYGKAELSAEEQAFIDNQVETLLAMVDDFKIVNETKDLPEPVWDYLKKEGFFSLIIPKSYGGREFSAIANSTIVTRIATKSLSVAVTVMVPNSLGPGELLMHYGTQAQKDFWLPGLANGKEVPCFALTGPDGGLDKLLEQLRLWHGGLRVEPGHFTGWSLGARFYPVLYLLTRMGAARDWGTGLPLKASLLGRLNRLEVHHIFPKAQLYKRNFKRPEVNALGNFCFLTKDTNLVISNRLPEDYFPAVEEAHPGALASQWIPADPALWKIENYREFLEARKSLLAAEVNQRMEELLHGDTRWLAGPAAIAPVSVSVGSGITSEAEEEELEALNGWMEARGLPLGMLAYDFADATTGEQKAIFDLAWPNGIQVELSQPVVVLLNESNETLTLASQAGFRCFTAIEEFKRYVNAEILAVSAAT